MKKIATQLIHIGIILLTVCATLPFGGCKNEPVTNYQEDGRATREVDLDEFVCIQTSASIDVFYTQGPDSKIKIDAPKHLIDHVVATVKKGILIITFDTRGKKVQFSADDRIDIAVTAPNVSGFYCKSSGNIIMENDVKQDGKMEFGVACSGDIKVIGTITCGSLSAESSGTGDIGIHGVQCQDMDLSVSSTGDIRVKDCGARNVTARTVSSGDISVYGYAINASLSAKNSGDIFCRDLICKNVEAEAFTGGEVRCNATESAVIESGERGYVFIYGNPRNLDTTKAKRFIVK